jgi:hypothetical protein
MIDGDFCKATYPTECNRLMFLLNDRGLIDTYLWVRQAATTYKRHVLHAKARGVDRNIRRTFAMSYLDFKRFLKNHSTDVDLK